MGGYKVHILSCLKMLTIILLDDKLNINTILFGKLKKKLFFKTMKMLY